MTFVLDGQELTLKVSVREDGSLWAVFGETTSGHSSYRFRFLHPSAPDAEGRTTLDFNLAVAVAVGERVLLRETPGSPGSQSCFKG
ncbi:DUF1684 domain-containing protein [Streptomyces sp. NPDC019531]|uniref:DUF1684 domain-containing protein n=1 Tax=Streptomyces sp. NPDC019531 TaxID=3365062 RepID=UPI00384EAEAC